MFDLLLVISFSDIGSKLQTGDDVKVLFCIWDDDNKGVLNDEQP